MRGLVVAALTLVLAGCSGLGQRTAEITGKLVAAAGDAIHPVSQRRLDGDGMRWLLEQQYDEPPVLDGFQMDHQARTLCQQGYVKDQVYALAPRRLAVNPAACVTADCRYTLVWQIHCEEMPQEPFSIFGKF